MANAIERVLQLGNETTWGTGVAPSKQMAGIMPGVSIPPSLVTEILQTQRGSVGPGNKILDLYHEVNGVSVPFYMIYEELPWYMNMLATGVEAGEGPYTQTYTAPEATAVTPDYMTLVFGADSGVYGVTSAFAKSLSLEWAYGQAVTGSVDIGGYSVNTDALEALSETAVGSLTYATGCQVSIAIDAWGGAMGTTPFTKCLSGSMTINAQREYLGYAGSCYPGGTFDPIGFLISGSLKLESDATSAGWVDDMLSAAQSKLIRITMTNSAAGAALRSAQFNIMAQITVSDTIADDNGLQIFDLDYTSVQEDDNDYFTAVLTNNVEDIWPA